MGDPKSGWFTMGTHFKNGWFRGSPILGHLQLIIHTPVVMSKWLATYTIFLWNIEVLSKTTPSISSWVVDIPPGYFHICPIAYAPWKWCINICKNVTWSCRQIWYTIRDSFSCSYTMLDICWNQKMPSMLNRPRHVKLGQVQHHANVPLE